MVDQLHSLLIVGHKICGTEQYGLTFSTSNGVGKYMWLQYNQAVSVRMQKLLLYICF